MARICCRSYIKHTWIRGDHIEVVHGGVSVAAIRVRVRVRGFVRLFIRTNVHDCINVIDILII